MDTTDIKMLDLHGKHKSAIIYRDDSARYVYVCFHCGNIFNDIDDTVQHIESHFQVVKVLVDEFVVEEKKPKLVDCLEVPLAIETVDIKIEKLDDYDFDDNTMSTQSESMCEEHFQCKVCNSIYASKFLIRIHVLNDHLQALSVKCQQCTKTFTNHLEFQSHLNRHISKKEVSWESVADGIAAPMNFSWSTYEECETSANVLAPIIDMLQKDNPKRRASNESTNVEAKRKKRVYARSYKCHKCPKSCRYISELKHHLQTHTVDETLQIFRCKVCDCYYKNEFELRVHILGVHHKMNQIKCKACSAGFSVLQNKQFEEHLDLHKRWTNISEGILDEGKELTMYEEIDSFNEPKYPCEFCTQQFYIKCNLDMHMKSVHPGHRHPVFKTPKEKEMDDEEETNEGNSETGNTEINVEPTLSHVDLEVVVKDYMNQKGVAPKAVFQVNGNSVEEFCHCVWSIIEPFIKKEIIFNEEKECYEWSSDINAADDLYKFVVFIDKFGKRSFEVPQLSNRMLNSWTNKKGLMCFVFVYGKVLKKKQHYELAKQIIQPNVADSSDAVTNTEVIKCMDELKKIHSDLVATKASWLRWANWIKKQPGHEREALMRKDPPADKPNLLELFKLPGKKSDGIQEIRSGISISKRINERNKSALTDLEIEVDELVKYFKVGLRKAERIKALLESMDMESQLTSSDNLTEGSNEALGPSEDDSSRSLLNEINNIEVIDQQQRGDID